MYLILFFSVYLGNLILSRGLPNCLVELLGLFAYCVLDTSLKFRAVRIRAQALCVQVSMCTRA